ncbi:IS21 family transposase [Archangium violaceum]|uniref:IS21 family transposase n=1 Tax=Archangium violaceum TaxID=83451 RepID=UPI002B2FDEDA|nr:IS21 family transposase [Archangium violaceum]
MRKLREILRLHLEMGLTGRAIARSCGLSPSTVSDYLGRIKLARLSWPLPAELDDDAALTQLLFPDEHKPKLNRPEPDFARIHEELRRKHVTKQLLWQEYREQHPDGYQYSQFCEHYARWCAQLSVTMRQTHRAGEKGFVDFSGDGLELVVPETGERQKVKRFLFVLGASSYTYVEPVLGEDLATWVGCHSRALEYFGGVPQVVVPDNLKAAVQRPDRYEPELNPTYAELARHYGFAVVPARMRKPRDKAKVEAAVLLAERWILAVLRHQRFSTLQQVREAVRPLLEKLNERPMRKLGKSRRQLFEELDRPALKPLPAERYELAWWKKARVNIDYHIELDEHLYSVPYQLVGKQVDVRATTACVEVFHAGRRVASHPRASGPRPTTLPEHMPSSHRAHAQWTPSRILEWAAKVGPSTAALAEELMRRRKHPEQGFRACLGIIRLKETYGPERLERACARALRHRACSYGSVAAILRNKLEAVEPVAEERAALPVHENIRGPDYYH